DPGSEQEQTKNAPRHEIVPTRFECPDDRAESGLRVRIHVTLRAELSNDQPHRPPDIGEMGDAETNQDPPARCRDWFGLFSYPGRGSRLLQGNAGLGGQADSNTRSGCAPSSLLVGIGRMTSSATWGANAFAARFGQPQRRTQGDPEGCPAGR